MDLEEQVEREKAFHDAAKGLMDHGYPRLSLNEMLDNVFEPDAEEEGEDEEEYEEEEEYEDDAEEDDDDDYEDEEDF